MKKIQTYKNAVGNEVTIYQHSQRDKHRSSSLGSQAKIIEAKTGLIKWTGYFGSITECKTATWRM